MTSTKDQSPEVPSAAALVQRISQLESQMRKAKMLGAVATLVVAAVLIGGQTQPKKAPKALEDAVFRSVIAGSIITPNLEVRDPEGRLRARISIQGDAITLGLLDTGGKVGLLATVGSKATDTYLMLGDLYSGGVVELDTSAASASVRTTMVGEVASVRDQEKDAGKLRKTTKDKHAVIIRSTQEGAVVDLNDADDRTSISLAATRTGKGIVLFDSDQKDRIAITVLEPGPSISVRDADGSSRAVLGTTSLVTTSTGAKIQTAESSLVLYDRDSKVIYQAPPER